MFTFCERRLGRPGRYIPISRRRALSIANLHLLDLEVETRQVELRKKFGTKYVDDLLKIGSHANWTKASKKFHAVSAALRAGGPPDIGMSCQDAYAMISVELGIAGWILAAVPSVGLVYIDSLLDHGQRCRDVGVCGLMRTDEPTRTEQQSLMAAFAAMIQVGIASVVRFRADQFGLILSAAQVAIGVAGFVKVYSRYFKTGPRS